MIKKREKLLKMEDDLYKSILLALGYYIEESGYIYDQDLMQPITMNNRNIKYSSLIHMGETYFDPLRNRKLMIYLFDSFLRKNSIDTGIYYRLYYTESIYDNNISKTKLILDTSEGFISSGYFSNDTIKYVDMIFKILDTRFDIDLHSYDIDYFRRDRK